MWEEKFMYMCLAILLVTVITSFVYIGNRDYYNHQKHKYKMFDGYVYKVDWNITNVKCVDYYKDKCYNMKTKYVYTIYANNTETFCVANIKSKTNITAKIMSDYSINTHVNWSKRKSKNENHECKAIDYRHYYQNKVNIYINGLSRILWVFISIISLMALFIIFLYIEDCFRIINRDRQQIRNDTKTFKNIGRTIENTMDRNDMLHNHIGKIEMKIKSNDTVNNNINDIELNIKPHTSINTTKDVEMINQYALISNTENIEMNIKSVNVPSNTEDIEINIKSDNVPSNTEDIKSGKIQSMNECALCFHIQRKIAFVPCGHTQTCEECYNKLQKSVCPLCGKEVQIVLKIFEN